MSLIDILTRIDAICKKYDIDSEQDPSVFGYGSIEADIGDAALLQKLEADPNAKSRASAAEIGEVSRLGRLAVKKVKGLSREELAACNNSALGLPERIQKSMPEIKFYSGGRFEKNYFHQQTEESSLFRQEHEMPKMKQVDKARWDFKHSNDRPKGTVNQVIKRQLYSI